MTQHAMTVVDEVETLASRDDNDAIPGQARSTTEAIEAAAAEVLSTSMILPARSGNGATGRASFKVVSVSSDRVPKVSGHALKTSKS